MDNPADRMDKDDGRNEENIPVFLIIAHNLTHTLPTDAEDIITTNYYIFG